MKAIHAARERQEGGQELSRLAAILALGLLASCAVFDDFKHAPMASPTPRPASNCGGGGCAFEVRVTGCSANQISVSQDPIVVDPRYHGPMQWRLVTPGWNFANPGIKVYDPHQEFSTVSNGAQMVTLDNHHRHVNVYKYAINVVPQGGGSTCTRDPTIMN